MGATEPMGLLCRLRTNHTEASDVVLLPDSHSIRDMLPSSAGYTQAHLGFFVLNNKDPLWRNMQYAVTEEKHGIWGQKDKKIGLFPSSNPQCG